MSGAVSLEGGPRLSDSCATSSSVGRPAGDDVLAVLSNSTASLASSLLAGERPPASSPASIPQLPLHFRLGWVRGPQSCLAAWAAIGASPLVMSWLADGIPLLFEEPPPPCCLPNKIPPAARLFARAEVAALQSVGAIYPGRPRCVCPLNVAPKAGGTAWRLIHDLRFVNRFLPARHFRLDSLGDVPLVVSPGDWFCSIDLKSGYHHLLMHPEARPYLGFEFDGVHYVWAVLPFGLSLAPFFFAKVTRVVAAHWRRSGIRCLVYLDDFFFAFSSPDEATAGMHRILADLFMLGLCVNRDKSVLEPTQRLQFLGLFLDSAFMAFQVPQAKVDATLGRIRGLLAAPPPLTPRSVARVTGLLMSWRLAVSPTRLFTRALYALLAPFEEAPLAVWDHRVVTLSAAARRELSWWLGAMPSWNGASFAPSSGSRVLSVFTDAAGEPHLGWGGWLQLPDALLEAQGHWSWDSAFESVLVKEMWAVAHSLAAFSARIPPGTTIRVRSDNTGVIVYLNSGGGRVPRAHAAALEIWRLCQLHSWRLGEASHIPGVENCRADRLSRVFDHSDWRLNPQLFAMFDRLWGPYTFDRFASALNRQAALPFNSRLYEPGSAGVDALAQDWRGSNSWVNPDFNLIGEVLLLLRAQRATATIVVPEWPGRPWWTLLTAMVPSAAAWVEVPLARDTFLSGRQFNLFSSGPPPWRVWAVRVIAGGGAQVATSSRQ